LDTDIHSRLVEGFECSVCHSLIQTCQQHILFHFVGGLEPVLAIVVFGDKGEEYCVAVRIVSLDNFWGNLYQSSSDQQSTGVEGINNLPVSCTILSHPLAVLSALMA
jgi:hypothetical protein